MTYENSTWTCYTCNNPIEGWHNAGELTSSDGTPVQCADCWYDAKFPTSTVESFDYEQLMLDNGIIPANY